MSSNIYYHPEKYGLEVIGAIDDPNASWDFDLVVFWKKGRKVYAGSDSGCSCPIPFEDQGIDNLTEIRTVRAAQEFIEATEREHMHYDVAEKRDLLSRVGHALQGRSQ